MASEPPAPTGLPGPGGGGAIVVRAWAVRDTGLAPAPPRHRRLPGALRHHQGQGPTWPADLALHLDEHHLEVRGVGRWPLGEVQAEVVHAGPPVVFSLAVPGSHQLLAAPGDAATATLLRRLGAT